ncbi:MAG: DEAD/DEAH box helicase [Bacteroidales bacterium]
MIKNTKDILEKFGIESLNKMQSDALKTILSTRDVLLLSPTGTGKTLGFLLPLLNFVDEEIDEVQVLILVPSRELAQQIHQVFRKMGTGLKVNAVYGGRSGYEDRKDLKRIPSVLIGTPGRVADLLNKEKFSTVFINTLILDEFDKSLEVGFENEMKDIISCIPNIKRHILTSATQAVEIPEFVGITNPKVLDYSDDKIEKLQIKGLNYTDEDDDILLLAFLHAMGNNPGIIFCNFKNTIQDVSDLLDENNIKHGCFYGGMEQLDRERTLVKFRNGTLHTIISTDLAARGLDIPDLSYILHYQMPQQEKEFIHRNGRTARMNAEGTAYVMYDNYNKRDYLSDDIEEMKIADFKTIADRQDKNIADKTGFEKATLFIGGGRRNKISKGDIAGFVSKIGGLSFKEIGMIELSAECSFVAVPANKIESLIEKLNNKKLKTKKVLAHWLR